MSRKTIAIEEGFEPCRSERCSDLEIHPKHTDDPPLCPHCASTLIKMPRKRMRCSACAWRGKLPSKKPKTKKAIQLHA